MRTPAINCRSDDMKWSFDERGASYRLKSLRCGQSRVRGDHIVGAQTENLHRIGSMGLRYLTDVT
jgi:hypothetical protein